MNGWMNEWTDEWICKWLNEWCFKFYCDLNKYFTWKLLQDNKYKNLIIKKQRNNYTQKSI